MIRRQGPVGSGGRTRKADLPLLVTALPTESSAVASPDARRRTRRRVADVGPRGRPLGRIAVRVSRLRRPPPRLQRRGRAEHARTLASIAKRAEQAPDDGIDETDLQTLDFVRCLARGMADAAAVPVVEFTISDTFAAPVGNVLTSLPKLPLDTEERKEGYLTRLRGLPGMLATVAQRHDEGARPGGRRWPGSSSPPSRNST